MTDEQIMQKILEKDPEAFNEVYNKLYRKLFLFANSLIANTEEARDIVTESFIKLWSQENYFSNMTHLQVYFYTVIKNACIDYLRRDKLKAKIENRLVKEEHITENVIEKKYQEAELVQILYDRINQLPDRMQQVFKLTYLDGFSRTEVAQMLNLSENTIRNTNAAAMKALRLTLGVEQVMILIFIALLFMMAA
ncbi:RNA polymerase, sigma-24 subunit, ECF subfamily [Niastella koreensis GR20-10]|uniref:RNA polymerase, sigma-24 subunit, ECF subfamily n=2 Tax=Niastella koreensis TaxID=354356 RepID=G8TC88_NIAKG|nr:RNA polymerase sigma-70 factor [Niastella koreensis]AEW00395.1 RNA polymerase, sigma-24 subunit, ECF subfamily [Niastella koreensis GR20-10]